MKFLSQFLFMMLCASVFTSCNDDELSPNPPNGETDQFVGEMRTLTLREETEGFKLGKAVCHMIAPNGSEISRNCVHQRTDGVSSIHFSPGLSDGEYSLLYFEYELSTPIGKDGEITSGQFGLGSRINVENNTATVIDSFDKEMMMAGTGTEDDPFIVTCGPHLYNLTLEATKFSTYDKYIGAYFKQVADISLHDASYYCDHTYGWTPIGNDPNYPFTGFYDGGGHKISGMYSNRDDSYGVGLFGYINNASIENLNIVNASMTGNHAVGGIVGYIMSKSGESNSSSIINCTVSNSTIAGKNNSVGVGGILGAIDMYTSGNISGCQSANNDISADYNAGGIVGGASVYSTTLINLCKNSSTVSTKYAGCGGIIGVADTLSVTTSENSGQIVGATAYTTSGNSVGRGVGGICGGAGISYFSGCQNMQNVRGYEGVGGIIGSTRLAGGDNSSLIYNSTLLRYCKNSGNITGEGSYVGGMCGESQFGGYGLINTGNIKGADHVAGIIGNTGVAVLHNTVNTGNVSGQSYISGISGQSSMGIYALCQNYGAISGSGSHSAGVVGLSGNNTLIHYCSNHGSISGASTPIGGIVGEIGDPREWAAMNYVECVFGSIEVVASFIGPVFAVVEHFAEGAKTVLKVTEIVSETILKSTSAALLAHSKHLLEHPEKLDTINAEIESGMNQQAQFIMDEINNSRTNEKYTIPSDFSTSTMDEYASALTSLSNYITTSNEENSNNTHFNEKLNETMEERAERVEELNESKELLFQVVVAITLMTSTACAIIATAATGGAAAPLLIGTFAGVVGGINSISKGASDFTDNVIILSQCVNTGEISCSNASNTSNAIGGLGGIIYDRGWVHDCLNAGDGPSKGGAFVGKFGAEHNITNCLSIANEATWNGIIGDNSASISEESGLYYYSDFDCLTKDEIASSSSYKGWDFNSSNGLWKIPTLNSGISFPVPFTSEMTK